MQESASQWLSTKLVRNEGELGPWAVTGLVLRDSLTNGSGAEHGGFEDDAGGKIADVQGALWPAPSQVLSIAIPFLFVFTFFQVYRRLRHLRTLERIRRSELGASRESIAQT